MGVTIKRVSIASVPVSDQDRALDFYVGALGFELLDDEPMGSMRWLRVGPAGAETSLTLVNWFDSMPAGSLKGLVLESDHLEETVERLRAKGVAVEGIEEAPWGRFATFYDPDGNGIVLRDLESR